jgi:F-type H+-transporting ATPase subunit b
MDLLRITVIGGLLGGLALGSLGVGTSIARAQHEEPFHAENAEEAEELLDEAHEAGGHDEHGAAGAHGSEAEHGEAHAAELDMPRLAGQLINFLLWAGILYWLLKDRLPAFLSSRRATIQGELDEAARMKAEAERKFAEYSERIENLDHELDRMREEMRKGGLAERDRIVAEAASRGEKMRAEARFLVEQQMKQLREDLTREAIEAAVGAAESILKERALDPVRGSAEQQRLATDYLDRLAVQLKDGALSPTATTKNEKPSA